MLVAGALAFVSRAAYAQESMPDMLLRVAPSVVQIKVGEEAVGSGFVYPTQRHVTTSYSVVNRDGELVVILAGDKLVHARVVAWSEADDLAILELQSAVKAAPLQLEPTMGFAGQDVVLLGRPTLVRPDAVDEPVRRQLATPRFGVIGLVSARQVNVDVDIWSGDDGAPIITTAGRVLGVVSGRAEQRLGLIDAASATRIDAARKQIGKQGAFDPHPRADQGAFAGVYVAPWQAYHQVGAGLLSSDGRADLLLVLQDVEGPVLLGVSYAPFAQAARLDIGLVFGR